MPKTLHDLEVGDEVIVVPSTLYVWNGFGPQRRVAQIQHATRTRVIVDGVAYARAHGRRVGGKRADSYTIVPATVALRRQIAAEQQHADRRHRAKTTLDRLRDRTNQGHAWSEEQLELLHLLDASICTDTAAAKPSRDACTLPEARDAAEEGSDV